MNLNLNNNMENTIDCINKMLYDIKCHYNENDKLDTIKTLVNEQIYIENLTRTFIFKFNEIEDYKPESISLKNDIKEYIIKIKKLYSKKLNKILDNIIENKEL